MSMYYNSLSEAARSKRSAKQSMARRKRLHMDDNEDDAKGPPNTTKNSMLVSIMCKCNLHHRNFSSALYNTKLL